MKVRVYGVPENYFDVVNEDYYVPKSLQSGLTDIPELSNGELNPIAMLYSDQELNPYPAVTSVNSHNAYNITYS